MQTPELCMLLVVLALGIKYPVLTSHFLQHSIPYLESSKRASLLASTIFFFFFLETRLLILPYKFIC